MTQRMPCLIDPNDPRAPTQERWDALSPEERVRVVNTLPIVVPIELFMPEGDRHRKAKGRAIDALGGFFQRIGRRVYVSSEMNVYYPGQPRFCPDVFAVTDVDPHERDKWAVSQEGKGLDVVIEVHVAGEFKKDFEANRKRYAALGIREYFLFDRTRGRLYGWRLPTANSRVYEAMMPQGGLFRSEVLDVEIAMADDRLRFYYGSAPLPESEDLIAKLESMVGTLVAKRQDEEQELEVERRERERAEQQRMNAEQQRMDAEQQRADAEQQRDAALERVAALEAELARLRGG